MGNAALRQKELSVQIGDRLQLQKTPADRPERYVVQVVGVMPGQSVIVTTPRINGKVAIIRPDSKFTVRVLQGSSVFGFVSSVLQSYSAPFPHLHLSYPREMESIVVRNALRAPTDIQGMVRNTRQPDSKEHYRLVRVVDLSNSGARLVSKGPLGKEEELLSLQFLMPVCGVDEGMGLLGQIRSMGKRQSDDDPMSFWTGVQFNALNRFQKVLLHAYVLERFVGDTGG
jgi:c-di-GMP-binding flagellar brake protein YcgR